jgi:hypothetical protein
MQYGPQDTVPVTPLKVKVPPPAAKVMLGGRVPLPSPTTAVVPNPAAKILEPAGATNATANADVDKAVRPKITLTNTLLISLLISLL